MVQFTHRKAEAHAGIFQLSSFSKMALVNWFSGLYLMHGKAVIISTALMLFWINICTDSLNPGELQYFHLKLLTAFLC